MREYSTNRITHDAIFFVCLPAVYDFMLGRHADRQVEIYSLPCSGWMVLTDLKAKGIFMRLSGWLYDLTSQGARRMIIWRTAMRIVS